MQHGLPRHLANDGLGKVLNFVAEKMLRLDDYISHNPLRLAQGKEDSIKHTRGRANLGSLSHKLSS